MLKITELTEIKYRTIHHKDAFGKRVRGQVGYRARRKVRTVKSGPRFAHFFIDVMAFQILLVIVQFILGLLQSAVGYDSLVGQTVVLMSTIGLLLFYPLMYVVTEYYWQQSPGKYLTKTVVINEYGNKPDLSQVVLRSLIRMVPFEPFSCAGDTHSYGWHDSWSETFVVPKEELENLKRLQKEQA